MITAKAYNGFACDVWSIGCIFLELIIGREDFTRLWMGSYAMEILTDIPAFREEIQRRSLDILSLIANGEQFNNSRDDSLVNMVACHWIEQLMSLNPPH